MLHWVSSIMEACRRIHMMFKLPMMQAPANSPFSWIATVKSRTTLPKALLLLDLVKHQRWKNYFARKLRMQSMPSWKENETGQKADCWLNYCQVDSCSMVKESLFWCQYIMTMWATGSVHGNLWRLSNSTIDGLSLFKKKLEWIWP